MRIGVVSRAIFVGQPLRLNLHLQRLRATGIRYPRMSKFSIMFSICSVARPCVFAGMPYTSTPRYFVTSGSTHSAWCSRRSSAVSHPPMRLKYASIVLRNRPVVEGVAAAFGNHAVGVRQVGIAPHVVLVRRHAARRSRSAPRWPSLPRPSRPQKCRHVALDVVADDLRRRIAVLAGRDRRLEELSPLQLSVALVQRPPAVQRARR